MDAVVAELYGKKKINGKVYAIRPVTSLTQRFARELRAQMERETDPVQLTAGEFTARVAVRCLDPQPSEEEADAMPIAVLELVVERASTGIEAMQRLLAEGEPKKEGAPAVQAPTPSP